MMPFIPTFESCESEKHVNQQDASRQFWIVKGIRSHVSRWTPSIYAQHHLRHRFALFSLCGQLLVMPTWMIPVLQSSSVLVFKPIQPNLPPPILRTSKCQLLSAVINERVMKIQARVQGKSSPWRNQGEVFTQSNQNCREHVNIGRFPGSCGWDCNYVQRVRDAIELIVMRSEREPFLDNFAAYLPSRRTAAELEGFPWGVLRHKTRLIFPITRWE